MSSPPRSKREEEQRLNMRTLVIASAASATAALVTSRLWIAGTWIAAAMTPVLVTLISELLRRPTERIARGITTDGPALQPDAEASVPRAVAPESAAAERVAERLRGGDPARALPDPEAPLPQARPREAVPRGAPPAPTRVYRSEASLSAPRRRRIAFRVVFATAALAFAIGLLVLTAGELLGGGSFGNNDRRVTVIPGSSKQKSSDNQAPASTTPDQTETQTEPQQPTTTTETPTDTETTPTTPTAPEQQPPGEPAPTDTTQTTPAQP
ncbi:MAG: hypothetical protein QOK00_1024 [Thermoleophilaceae bacterium]|nr:hypothetical protein [Thermoleophilaceae bacterium]